MIRPGSPGQDRTDLRNFLGNSRWRERNPLKGGFSGDTREAVEALAAEVLRLGDLVDELSRRLQQLESRP
jgi:hypothetical protein